MRDVGLLDRLIGVQFPLNLSETPIATRPLDAAAISALSPFFLADPPSTLTVSTFPRFEGSCWRR